MRRSEDFFNAPAWFQGPAAHPLFEESGLGEKGVEGRGKSSSVRVVVPKRVRSGYDPPLLGAFARQTW